MPLSDTKIKALKPTEKRRLVADEKGLWLLVPPKGSKRWVLVFHLHGKRREAGLGTYPAVGLKRARQLRDEMRAQVAEGVDPVAARKAAKAAEKTAQSNTFEAIFREWYRREVEEKMAPKTRQKITSVTERYILPHFGKTPIEEITVADVLHCLRNMQDRGIAETALKAKGYISKVFRFAAPLGLVQHDPTTLLKDAIKREKTEHLAAITDPKEVGHLLQAIEGYEGQSPVVPVALTISALSLLRPGEVRKLEWSSVNWEKKRLEVSVTKTGTQQFVPLARQAEEALRALHPLTGQGRYVFPSARGMGRPMSENAVRVALRNMGFKNGEMTAHGFRAMARTLLEEELRQPVEIIEAALSHTVKDALGRAYNRTTHIEARTKMMQRWADYLDALKEQARTGNVVPVNFAEATG